MGVEMGGYMYMHVGGREREGESSDLLCPGGVPVCPRMRSSEWTPPLDIP